MHAFAHEWHVLPDAAMREVPASALLAHHLHA